MKYIFNNLNIKLKIKYIILIKMPKNMGKGGNKRKKGKKILDFERELVFKTEMQEYAQVLKLMGDSRLEVQCIDGIKRDGHIRGKMKKKVWVVVGDVVLVALREFEKEKCDILIKYTEDEVRKLKSLKEIPDNIKVPEAEQNGMTNNQEDNFFGYEKDVVDDKKKPQKKGDDLDDLDDEEESDDDWLNNRINNLRGKFRDPDEDDDDDDVEKKDAKKDDDEEDDEEEDEEDDEKEKNRKLEIEKKKEQEKKEQERNEQEKKEKKDLELKKKEEEKKNKEILNEIEKNKKQKDTKPQKQKEDKKEKINIDNI